MMIHSVSLSFSFVLGSAVAFAPLHPFLTKNSVSATTTKISSLHNPNSILLPVKDLSIATHYGGDMATTSTTVLQEVGDKSSAVSFFLIADDADALLQSADHGGIGGMLQSVLIGFGVIAAILIGLSILSATVIIPAAARELEQECKELAPDLWDEYLRKLEPGQTMAQRPDLIQELGIKLQPLLDAKIQKQFDSAKEKGIDVSKDEEAWNAIDKLNEKVPTVPSMGSSSPKASNEGTTIDVSTMTNQWDDSDDVDDASSKRN